MKCEIDLEYERTALLDIRIREECEDCRKSYNTNRPRIIGPTDRVTNGTYNGTANKKANLQKWGIPYERARKSTTYGVTPYQITTPP